LIHYIVLEHFWLTLLYYHRLGIHPLMPMGLSAVPAVSDVFEKFK